jgi:tyrosine-protein kinase Etk/Wzc
MKYMDDTIEELRRHTSFKLTYAGTIDMWAEAQDPKTAADMLNAYVELLDRFNREVRTTKGRRTRVFVGGRLEETKRDLARAEDRLAQYQATHKAAVLNPQTSTAIEQAARFYSQRVALEIRLGVLRSYSRGGSDEEGQIREQMAQLDRQLAALPETGLDLARLVRDVRTYEELYALLTTQYEEARIDEARDVASVDVLDPGIPPERRIDRAASS